jgi:hypothetical protein
MLIKGGVLQLIEASEKSFSRPYTNRIRFSRDTWHLLKVPSYRGYHAA